MKSLATAHEKQQMTSNQRQTPHCTLCNGTALQRTHTTHLYTPIFPYMYILHISHMRPFGFAREESYLASSSHRAVPARQNDFVNIAWMGSFCFACVCVFCVYRRRRRRSKRDLSSCARRIVFFASSWRVVWRNRRSRALCIRAIYVDIYVSRSRRNSVFSLECRTRVCVCLGYRYVSADI